MTAPARIPALLLLVAGLVCARESHADGGFLTTMEPIEEPTQTALIVHSGGIQEMTLEVSYEGPARDFGWIVPVPAVPEIGEGQEGLFDELATLTQALPLGRHGNPGGKGILHVDGGRSRPDGFTPVLSTRVFRAEETGELFRWMGDHRLERSPAIDRAVADYFDRGWVFVAMHIGADQQSWGGDAALTRGSIRPVHLRFPAAEPVFPLRISAVNPGPSDVLLYLVTDRYLAPRTGRHLDWHTRLGDARPYLPMRERYSEETIERLRTTRLFAQVRPVEMTEDLYFTTYDPGEALLSRKPRERAEAITVIGLDRRVDLAPRLIAYVEAIPVDLPGSRWREELNPALWALGEIGTPAVVPLLAEWAGDPSRARSIVALRALTRIDAPEVEPVLLAHLADRRTVFSGREATRGGLAAHRRLAQKLDPTHVDEMNRAVVQARAHEEWAGLSLPGATFRENGALQLLALAARHGDPLARQTMLDALVRSGRQFTRPPEPTLIPIEMSTHPMFDQVDPEIVPRRQYAALEDWPALQATLVLLDDASGVAGEILREASEDHRLPPHVRRRLRNEITILEKSFPSLALTSGAAPSARAGANGSS